MTPALRWAAMRAILMFHNCEGQSHKTVSTDHNFWSERRAEADSNRGPSAYQPNALPLDQTGSRVLNEWLSLFIARVECPSCTYSAVWLLRGWCLVNWLLSGRVLCTSYNQVLKSVSYMKEDVEVWEKCQWLIYTFSRSTNNPRSCLYRFQWNTAAKPKGNDCSLVIGF